MFPIKTLLVNPDERRYRVLWRIVFQILIMLVIVALPIAGISETATWLLKSGRIDCSPEIFDKIMDMIVGILLTVLVLLSLSAAARWLDHRKFSDFGLHITASWWKQYFLGIMFGSLLMVLIFTIESVTGWVDINDYFHISAPTLPWWIAFMYPVVKASCVGVYEEAIGRGYLITNLKEGMSGVWNLSEQKAFVFAIISSSVFFGVLHIGNPNASVISIFSLMFNGALFATAYVLTGQLGMCIGLHMSWNLFQGLVFGFPVSGDHEIATMFHIQQSGPNWITGGNFGPEGGLLGLGSSVIGIIILIRMRRVIVPLSHGHND